MEISKISSRLAKAIISEENPKTSSNKIEVKGKFKTRLQVDQEKDKENKINSRQRLRFSGLINAVATLTEQDMLKIALDLGVRTGEDPRSSNITFENVNSKPISISSAALLIKIVYFQLIIGKMTDAFSNFGIFVDKDINFEGAVLKMDRSIEQVRMFFNGGGFVLDERKDSNDSWLYVVQMGVIFDVSQYFSIQVSPTMLFFTNMRGNTFETTSKSNTVDSEGNLLSEFMLLNPALSLIFKIGSDNNIKLNGEYIFNDENKQWGYSAGMVVGPDKLKDLGQLQFNVAYHRSQPDLIPDFMPNSDIAGGRTGEHGFNCNTSVGLGSNLSVGMSYFFSSLNLPSLDEKTTSHTFQFDLNATF